MKGLGMAGLMKQAKKMQEDVQKAQEDLKSEVIQTTSGGGLIKIEMSGNKELKSISIDKSVIDADDIESLEDLIIIAINDANKKVDILSEEKLSKTGVPSGGLGGML